MIPNGIKITAGAHTSPLVCEICGAAETKDRRPFSPEGLRAHKAKAHRVRMPFDSLPRQVSSALSLRQTEILELLSQGKTMRQISLLLGLGFNTVRTHLKRAYQKLNVENRTTAVIAFLNAEGVKNHEMREVGESVECRNRNRSQKIPMCLSGFRKFCPVCGCDLTSFDACSVGVMSH